MVGLPGAVIINGLVVNDPPGGPVMLGGDHHAGAPAGGLVHGDPLYYTEPDVSVQPSFHLVGPVDGYGGWGVDSHGPGLPVHEQLQWGAVLHEGERLPLTHIEGTCSVPVEDVLLEGGQVGLGGCTGQRGWCSRWWLSGRT